MHIVPQIPAFRAYNLLTDCTPQPRSVAFASLLLPLRNLISVAVVAIHSSNIIINFRKYDYIVHIKCNYSHDQTVEINCNPHHSAMPSAVSAICSETNPIFN